MPAKKLCVWLACSLLQFKEALQLKAFSHSYSRLIAALEHRVAGFVRNTRINEAQSQRFRTERIVRYVGVDKLVLDGVAQVTTALFMCVVLRMLSLHPMSARHDVFALSASVLTNADRKLRSRARGEHRNRIGALCF
jgi:hypothetical protein